MDPEKLGPFKIGRVLGRGGMGAVYEGILETDGSVAAIKVLQESFEEDTETRQRFESEIETLKRLHHPNIVRLSGFGEEQGWLYYVMELVDGTSLQQELRKKRLFLWYEVAKIGLDICLALRHAHDRGVIHRDIKPANILLNRNGDVKLSDFGIARFFGARQLTDAHSIVGTLEYMSPEQALANPITTSSDLYSLGCVLFALLTGKPPFPARSLPELLRKHKSPPQISIPSLRHDVPSDLEHLITDLLQIRPEDRPRNALLASKRLQALLQVLVGVPAAVKVLPMSPETPTQHHEQAEPLSNYDFHLSTSERSPDGKIPFPQDTLPSDSPQYIDEEYPIRGPHTVPSAGGNSRLQSSGEKTTDSGRVSLLANTVTALSTPKYGEILPSPRQPLRPAKDEPLPDATERWSESPSVKSEIVAVPKEPSSQRKAGAHGQQDKEQHPVDASGSDANAAFRHRETLVVDPAKSAFHFTAVSDKSLGSLEEDERPHPLFSLSTVLASTTLMIVGLTVYYLLQPIPPDKLFARIIATIRADESAEGYSPALLRSAQDDIRQFLDKYPDHPAAEQVWFYQDELDLLEHERRLERRMQFSTLRSLSPVERAYVEVLTSTPNDPEQTIDNLRAFIAVFQPGSFLSEESASSPYHSSGPVAICVELARRRLIKLERDVTEINAEQKHVLWRRLDEAMELDATDPMRADEIRQGIIHLYQNHRWAKELIEQVEQQLQE